MKAASLFDDSKGFKFSTFAIPVIENEIRSAMRKEKKHHGCISLDSEKVFSNDEGKTSSLLEKVPYEEPGFELAEHSDLICSLLEISKLKEKERQAVFLVICKGLTQESAGSRIGLSQSVTGRYVKSGIKKIRKEYWK